MIAANIDKIGCTENNAGFVIVRGYVRKYPHFCHKISREKSADNFWLSLEYFNLFLNVKLSKQTSKIYGFFKRILYIFLSKWYIFWITTYIFLRPKMSVKEFRQIYLVDRILAILLPSRFEILLKFGKILTNAQCNVCFRNFVVVKSALKIRKVVDVSLPLKIRNWKH